MIIERAEMQVHPAMVEDFIRLLAKTHGAILSGGCKSLKVLQAEENAVNFLLLAEWDAVAAHTAFLQSPEGLEFANAVGSLLSIPPQVDYFHSV